MIERENGMFFAWRRYWARGLDLFFYSLLLSMISMLVFHVNINNNGIERLIIETVVQLLLILLLEPLLLNRFGTTLGKAVLGIRVTQENGEMLTISQGFTRTLLVLIKGMGLLIPIYSLYTQYKSYRRCSDYCIQPWDVGLSYTIKDTKCYRWIVYVAVNAALLCGVVLLMVIFVQIPPNRGNLTVAEFSENYNYFVDYYDAFTGGQYLGADGTWQDKTADEIYPIDLSDLAATEFVYEVEDGYVTGVSFSVEEKNKDAILHTFDTQMLLAVLAYVGAQKDIGLLSGDRGRMADFVGTNDFRDFHIVYRGIDITCYRESKGYKKLISELLIPEEGAENLYYKAEFSMRQDENAIGVQTPSCTYLP